MSSVAISSTLEIGRRSRGSGTAGRQVVEHEHLRPLGEQAIDQVAADEPRAAGHDSSRPSRPAGDGAHRRAAGAASRLATACSHVDCPPVPDGLGQVERSHASTTNRRHRWLVPRPPPKPSWRTRSTSRGETQPRWTTWPSRTRSLTSRRPRREPGPLWDLEADLVPAARHLAWQSASHRAPEHGLRHAALDAEPVGQPHRKLDEADVQEGDARLDPEGHAVADPRSGAAPAGLRRPWRATDDERASSPAASRPRASPSAHEAAPCTGSRSARPFRAGSPRPRGAATPHGRPSTARSRHLRARGRPARAARVPRPPGAASEGVPDARVPRYRS